LVIAPVCPTTWDGFTVKRLYQGALYSISVKRKGKGNTVRLTVNGKHVEGNLIPKPDSGVNEVEVQVILT
jgi:cellobiose phosphorylase